MTGRPARSTLRVLDAAQIVAVSAASVAALAMLGLLNGLDPLAAHGPGGPVMSPMTAAVVLAIATATVTPPGRLRAVAAGTAATIAAGAIGLRLGTGVDAGVSSFQTASALGLLATALLAERAPRAALAARLATLAIVLIVALGHATGIQDLYTTSVAAGMSAPTAVAVLLLTLAGLLRVPGLALALPLGALITCLVAGGVVTGAVVHGDEQHEVRELEAVTERTTASVQTAARSGLRMLEGLAASAGVGATDAVRLEEAFSAMSRPVLGTVVAQTGLTVRVPAQERSEVERAHGIRIRDREGARVRGPQDSWVLLAAGGIEGPDPLRGVDVAADPRRRGTIEEAVATGARRLTPPLPLFDTGEPGVIAYAPIFRDGRIPDTPTDRERQAVGVVTGVIRTAGLLDIVRPELRSDVRIALTDTGGPIGAIGSLGARTATRTIAVGGRRWEVAVSAAPPPRSAGWVAAGTGLLSVLLTLLAYVVARRERYARAMVEERMHERDVAESARQASDERYRILAENTGDMISRHRLDGVAVDVSAACDAVLGIPAEKAVGSWAADICHPDDRDAVRTAQATAANGTATSVAYRVPAPEGWRWLESALNPVVDHETGRTVEVVASTRDVDARVRAQVALRESERRLRELAEHDEATGLLNRRAFEAVLARPDGAAQRTLVVLDLDHFKFVNDSLGHAAGDDLLRRVADVLRLRTRSSDVVARLGGDEFAVLIDGPVEAGEAVARALSTALHALRTPMRAGGQRQVTASFGIAEVIGSGTRATEEALVAADLSMYDAKEAGRDTWRTYRRGDASALRMEARVGWEERVRHALAQDGFRLHYQPIVDLRTGATVCHEALLRLPDDRGDLAPPPAFLPVAQRLGLMRDIDRWVLGRVIADLAAHPHLALAANLSPQGLSDPALPAHVSALLRTHGVAGTRLTVEVTETAALSDLSAVAHVAAELDALGISIAIDDFGSGYATLSSLRVVPARQLKIDGEFIRGCATSERDRLLVQATVDLADRFGLETVAEWVEDAECAALMLDLGVTRAQGFHFGRPTALEPRSRPPVAPDAASPPGSAKPVEQA